MDGGVFYVWFPYVLVFFFLELVTYALHSILKYFPFQFVLFIIQLRVLSVKFSLFFLTIVVSGLAFEHLK